MTGAIQAREYYGETDVPNGKVKGYVSAEKLLKSPTLEEITLREFRYSQHSPAGSDLVVTAISEQIEYPHEASTADPIVTSWEYEYHPDTVQIKQRTTILPAIPTSQNGSGIATEKRELYDINGYLIATQDERGFINTFEYDPTRGVMLKQVVDDDAPTESDWTANAGTRLKLTTDFEYDSLGRQTQSLGPTHNVNGVNVRTATWSVFDDEDFRTLSGRGYATGSSPSYTYTLANPVQVTIKDADGRLLDSVQSIRASTSGRLTIDDLDDLLDQANWCRWTRQIYNQDGTLQKTRVYHDIPTADEGALGTNYIETEFSYDEMHRRNRVVSPADTITWTVFDVRGLPIQTFVGTNDEGGSDSDPTGGGSDPDNNMTLVAENEYDNGLSGYNGNLTQEVRPVDDNSSNNRTTAFGYDYRNRQIWIDGEVDFYRKSFYDNLNRVYQVDQYDTTDTGALVARQATAHDDRGRVYRTTRYAVDPSDGSVGSNPLVDNTWFDAAGNTIKSLPAGSQLFTKSLYDGAGRMTAQYQGIYTESGTEPYADVGEVTSDNTIFEQTISTYDEASNLIRVEHYQRFHDATGEGVLNGPSGANPKARVAYQGLWYDGISRSIATANYGTIPPDPWPTSPPSSSDTVLVSQTAYNQRGEAFATNDPAGTTSQTTFDDAGRAIEVVQDVNDLELTTTMTYHASGQIATLTALNADTGDQVTTYTYGSTLADSKIASNELLVEMEYPEGETASYAYDRQTERIKFTDPNATVHEYGYDALGRLVSDSVPTVGSGGGVIDATVLRIERSYEVRGLLRKVTSYSAASSGSVVNDVEMTYNEFGQLASDVQEHGGSVGGGSPRVQYAYADGSGNTVRPTQVTYPDGTVLTYDYGTSGGASDRLCRVEKISWS